MAAVKRKSPPRNSALYGRKNRPGPPAGGGEGNPQNLASLADSLLNKQKGKKKKGGDISYRAYEIIPTNSPYSHHFRTLLNAENFVSKKEYEMAIDIYQRLINKIPLKVAREKLETNIHDLQNIQDQQDEQESQKIHLDISYSGPPTGPVPQQPPPTQPGPPPQGQPPSTVPPIQIQMAPQPYPSTSQFPGTTPPQETGGDEPKPFGFFQQYDKAGPEQEHDEGEKKEDFDFFEKKDGIELIDSSQGGKKTNEILEDISGSVFNIEKAMFQTKEMEVETRSAEESEGKPPSSETPGEEAGAGEAPAGGEPGEFPGSSFGDQTFNSNIQGAGEQPEAPTEDQPQEEKTEGAEDNLEQSEEQKEEEGEEDRRVTGETPEEELSEGVLDNSSALQSLTDDFSGEGEEEESEFEEKPPVQEIRGVLELKEPEQEDTPFITITYDFNKIPHDFYLSKDHNILEYAYYKYKPMLVKAQKFIRKKQITKALNYYRVIRDQQIPDTLRTMVDKNIHDISEYLEKYLMTRPG